MRPWIYAPNGKRANKDISIGFVDPQTKAIIDQKPNPVTVPPPTTLPEKL